jgi:hypothetical protein
MTDAGAEVDFSVVRDDPLHRAQRAVGLIPRAGFGLGRRILVAIAVTWLPLVLWALWTRHLLEGVAAEPLLRHFGIHARFLVALPLFLVAEATTEVQLHRVVPQFLTSGVVDAAGRAAFVATLREGARLRRSRLAFVVLLAAVAAVTWAGWETTTDNHELLWAVEPDAPGRTFGALWFSFVSRPLFTLLLFAWLWRLVVLFVTFRRIAALDLRLSPTHPDRAGGLGFLETLPGGLAPFFLGVSVVIAARWGHQAVYHGLDVHALQVPFAVLVVLSVLLGVAPLLAFAPRLHATRRRALLVFGALLGEHGRAFERRWVHREAVDDDAILSAPEIGPVADTVALYETVSRQRPAPIGRSSVIPVALAAALPPVPVFATQMPVKEVLSTLLGPLVGL